MSELWAKWEGEVINGEFPLRRLVGVSDHSGVFLSEAPAYGLQNAAVKLVPAIPTLAESQLAHWNAAGSLAHPRLLRLFAAGRCQLGNLHFLYVLMEYADQNLGQLLENRPLTEIEARETLPPTLDGLAFLHSQNLVHGQLKPSNILVVGEQLKLASDTIRPAGEAATSISMLTAYDPPEAYDGSFSTAGDIWALGVTLYEALTRTTPARPDDRSHGVVLPPDFPPASADVIRECLSRRPADRPTVTALQAWISGKVRYPGVPSSAAATAASGVAAGSSRSGSHKVGESFAGTDATGLRAGSPSASSVGAANTGVAGVNANSVAAARAAGARATNVNAAGAKASGTGTSAAARNRAAPARTAPPSALGPTAAAPGAVPGRLTIRAVVEREPIEGEPTAQRSYLPWVIAAIAVVGIAWGAVRMLGGGHSSTSPAAASDTTSTNSSQPDPQPSDSSAQSARNSQGPATDSAASTRPAPTPESPTSKSEQRSRRRSASASATTSNSSTSSESGTATTTSTSVVHEEVPNVPRSALATIHGHVKVAVRVTVDSSGNVVDDSLDHAGPSHYFARVASQAARKWKFAPTGEKSARQWLVHFDFSRAGTTAHATGTQS
jgi:TonB family protein